MTQQPPAARLAFLDAARAVAALLVVAEHGLHQVFPAFCDWLLSYFSLGRTGVVLFLVISGYIIPHSLAQGGSNARFWLRRVFRLFPAYWVAIVLACACQSLGAEVSPVGLGRWPAWLINFTMIQRFVGQPDVLGIFWTLQLELVIYAVCSLLFGLGLLRRADWLIGGAAAAYLLASTVVVRKFNLPYQPKDELLALPPMVGFLAHRWMSGDRRLSPALIAALAVIPLLVHWHSHRWVPAEFVLQHVRWYAGHYLLAYLLFFALLALRRCPMPAAVVRPGTVSYSLYLIHPLVVLTLAPLGLSPGVFLAGLLALSWALAELVYRFVEVPGIALGRAAERRLWPPAPAAAPARRLAA